MALGGARTHGIGYAEAARAAGAVAVLVEPSMVDRVPAGLPALLTVDPRAAVGRVAGGVQQEDGVVLGAFNQKAKALLTGP